MNLEKHKVFYGALALLAVYGVYRVVKFGEAMGKFVSGQWNR